MEDTGESSATTAGGRRVELGRVREMRWVSVAVSVLLVGSVLVLVRVSTSPPDPATARTRRGKRSGSGRFGKAMQDEEPVLSVLVTGANGYVGSHVMATLDNKVLTGTLGEKGKARESWLVKGSTRACGALLRIKG